MRDYLLEVRKKVKIGVVGGSDITKVVEQLGTDLNDGSLFSFCGNYF